MALYLAGMALIIFTAVSVVAGVIYFAYTTCCPIRNKA